MQHRLWVAAAGTVLLAALAGCSASVKASQGPLGDVGPPASECLSVKPGQIVVDGVNRVPNSGEATAFVDKVALADPHGLRQLSAFLVPASEGLYGDWTGSPPFGDHHPRNPGFLWAQRLNADGAKVPHTKSYPAAFNLIVVMQTSGEKSTDRGIDIWYHVGSQHYHYRTNTSLETIAAPRNCLSKGT